MMSPQFIDHAFIYFNERRIVIQDDEGYDETVRFHFDEEGTFAFQDSVGGTDTGENAVYQG